MHTHTHTHTHKEWLAPGSGTELMASLAKEHGIVVVGGVVEQDSGRYFNTIPAFGPDGNLLVKYRKIHLRCDGSSRPV